jgi:hypothetical protein
MKRMALLSVLTCLLSMGAARAAEPTLCKSLCDSERRECRANVPELAADRSEGLMPDRNPMARAAQHEVPTPASQAVENVGTPGRRLGHAGECDATYLRCTRACAAPQASSVLKPEAARRNQQGR